MKLVKANPLIGKIESGAGNGFGQFWRRVPFTRLLLLVAALAAPRAFALNPAEKPADYTASRWTPRMASRTIRSSRYSRRGTATSGWARCRASRVSMD